MRSIGGSLWSKAFAVAAFVLLTAPMAATTFAFSAGQGPAVTLSTSNYSLAFDQSGNLWVSNGPGDQILEYLAPVTSSSTPIVKLSLGYSPNGIAFGAGGYLYVASYGNGKVYIYGPSLSLLSVLSVSSANGLTVDSRGNLWVASNANQLVEITNPETSPAVAVDATLGSSATDVAIGGQGIWVSYYTAGVVQEYSYPYAPTPIDTVSVSNPNSIAFDANGNLWVASNAGADLGLVEIAPPYTSITLRMTNGLGSDVTGVAVASNGDVWVADRGTAQVLGYAAPVPPAPPLPSGHVLSNFAFTNYGGSRLQGTLVGLVPGQQAEYNIPSINQTLLAGELDQGNYTLLPDAVTTCTADVGGQPYVNVTGFFSATWGGALTNSTEFIFGNYQSFLTSAAGWPAEPACS